MQDAQKAVQQGRSERRGESYSGPYGEPLSDARTPVAVFFRILLDPISQRARHPDRHVHAEENDRPSR
jgi:hypothetical protein